MSRVPLWIQLTIETVLFAVAMLGITNSTHLAAKILYALLIAVSSAALALSYRRSRG